ncbi:hypothetical protein Tsubulata_003549 [Turnera subulata]|uniref:Uncharacterized protein n=1 Tax=Turnera subulata TaxID=218843 RepID=A0A9Q0GBD5_9ROSI|nr:hypothetical protein Tsubulata_003549 [Turnera subulata]
MAFYFPFILFLEIEELLSEVQSSKDMVESFSLLLNEVFQSFSAIFSVFDEFKCLITQSFREEKLIVSNHKNLNCYMRQKVSEVEDEKLLLYNKCADFQKQIYALRQDAQNYEETSRILLQQQNLEKEEFLSEIQILQNEISHLSSCSLAKEKENMRKDLEKTKTKLKEAESKLKNAIQEKTKLEGEKACAEREVKRLHGQKILLERDINKREPLAGRRDSIVERSVKVVDQKRTKGVSASSEQITQEDYRQLEVLAFEMEATIATLEEAVAAAQQEKEEAVSRSENLALELEAMSKHLNGLQEEILHQGQMLEESASNQQILESSIKLLVEEKEELAMQFSDCLLKMEEEKAIWFAKEKASIEAMEKKAKLHNAEIASLSREITEIRNALKSCGAECKILQERLTISEENAKWEKKCSEEKSREIDLLKNEKAKADVVTKKFHEGQVNKKEMAKLRMRLLGTQAKLDAFRCRYEESINEIDFMNKKYAEGSRKLKDMLSVYAKEVVKLTKKLSAVAGEQSGH